MSLQLGIWRYMLQQQQQRYVTSAARLKKLRSLSHKLLSLNHNLPPAWNKAVHVATATRTIISLLLFWKSLGLCRPSSSARTTTSLRLGIRRYVSQQQQNDNIRSLLLL
eukprot:CAMPEP_0196658108 /NCGR_PEP_ID=MMETSP1086-20130531/27348_1 /TAXON_ID=77921 /ORGANISM="Cyanoptyche  gloeocystis , Strain SAG4.97" /LENGTH=108 /DNA_ID=CAMNT_0041991531 /DNA_START=267 /DNA_END=593 /DNA_ORIENTATION=-